MKKITLFTNILIIVTTDNASQTSQTHHPFHDSFTSFQQVQYAEMSGYWILIWVDNYTRPHVSLLDLWTAGIFIITGEASHVWSLYEFI